MKTKATRQPHGSNESDYQARVRPADWVNPKPKPLYDLVVLGAGPAGIEAARCAARLGFSVALVERSRLGGTSLDAGSVPSKALIRTANLYARMHEAQEFGAPVGDDPAVDFALVMTRVRAIRARIGEYCEAGRFAALGVDLFFGEGRFDGAATVLVAGARLAFRKAMVATGARPRPSNIPGLEAAGYRTSDSLFEMTVLPRRIAVIGGGPLGCELAQALRRLGPQVMILQNEPKFLPHEERDAAEILSRSMARSGVEIRLNTTVTGARKQGGAKTLQTRNNEVEADFEVDEVLLSIGRVPNIEGLGLEAAGIAHDARTGIATDDFFRTANPNIYAVGDVSLEHKFTNAARASARMAVGNALGGAASRRSALLVPQCTYCDPEIAHIGLHVWDARRRDIPIRSYTVMLQDVDRAITDGTDEGFVKIHVAQDSDTILGASIVASRASEIINEVAVAMNAGIGMTALAGMIHTYPSQSAAIMLAAQGFLDAQ